MKWIYLPFMFVLAFLYTKISFSNFQINGEQKTSSTARMPGSVSSLSSGMATFYKVPNSLLYKNLFSEDLLLFKMIFTTL